MEDIYWLGRIAKATVLRVSAYYEPKLQRLVGNEWADRNEQEGGYALTLQGQEILDAFDKAQNRRGSNASG